LVVRRGGGKFLDRINGIKGRGRKYNFADKGVPKYNLGTREP